MKDTELNALIRLLDDEDAEVSTHVWEKLTSLGSEGIDRLEAAWEQQEDPVLQQKIEELIHNILTEETTDDLLEWRKDGGKNLLEGWILLTRFQFPDLDEVTYRNEIKRLVNMIWLEVNQQMDPVEQLRTLSHILYQVEGFKGNRKDPNHPNNNYLNQVIDHKYGNPISLGLLYLIICQELEFRVQGVILPGYFALHYKDASREFYIDVFNGGAFFTKNDLGRFLKEIKVEPKPAYFKPTSNIYIILHTIRNLIAGYRKIDRPEKAREFETLLKDIEITF